MDFRMKNKAKKIENKFPLHSPLTFFNNSLSSLNNYRQQVNRSKNLANYLAVSHTHLRTLEPLDTTLGIMSFSIYLLRFSSNLCLLIQLILSEQNDQNNVQRQEELYYALFNDFLWSSVNLCQFFWLSFRNSQSAGFRGLQLEVIAQIIDLMVMIVRHEQAKEEYLLKYRQSTGFERAQLVIEWQNKELNFMRSVLTAVSIFTVLGIFSFSAISIPLAPVLSTIILISAISRLLIDMEKDKNLINQLKTQHRSAGEIAKKEQGLCIERFKELNQIMLFNIVLPVGLFCFLTIPTLPLSLLATSLICCLALYLIQIKFFNQDEVNGDAKPPMQLSPLSRI